MQDVKSNDQSFGGVIIVIVGDFQQILPVIHKGEESRLLEHVYKDEGFGVKLKYSVSLKMKEWVVEQLKIVNMQTGF